MRSTLRISLLAALLVTGGYAYLLSGQAAPPLAVEFSQSPDEVVLFLGVREHGGSSMKSMTVQGNGDVLLSLDHIGGDTALDRDAFEQYHASLSREEIGEMLGALVESGLADSHGRSIFEKQLAAGAKMSPPGAEMKEAAREYTLHFSIEGYSFHGQRYPRSQRTLTFSDVLEAVEAYPEIREIRAIGLIAERFDTLWRNAASESEGIGAPKSVLEPESEECTYTVSKDPGQIVFGYEIDVPMRGWIKSATLYGDGRLSLDLRRANGQILEQYEMQIDEKEIDRLFQKLASHRLMVFDPARVRAQKIRFGGGSGGAAPDDAGTSKIHFSLDALGYKGRTTSDVENEGVENEGVENEAVENEIEIKGALFQASYFPNIVELQGVRGIHREIEAIWIQAQGGRDK